MNKKEDKYYITENIFRWKNKLYFENGNQKIKLNNRNWYKFLKDYGWEKISKQWEKKLDLKKNYFAFLDCGGNGDCLFHCILWQTAAIDNYKPNYCYSQCYCYW